MHLHQIAKTSARGLMFHPQQLLDLFARQPRGAVADFFENISAHAVDLRANAFSSVATGVGAVMWGHWMVEQRQIVVIHELENSALSGVQKLALLARHGNRPKKTRCFTSGPASLAFSI